MPAAYRALRLNGYDVCPRCGGNSLSVTTPVRCTACQIHILPPLESNREHTYHE